MKRSRTIIVDNTEIIVQQFGGDDYISLTDMVRNIDGEDHIRNWMRNRSTLEFLGAWEVMYNPHFKGVEFDTFLYESGANRFNMTPTKWVAATNAIGIISKPGRNGGTYAHKDIAFEFGTWISPAFKLYLIKEYQRLKEIENNQYNLEWNVRRMISKANYTVHTDAVKDRLISATLWDQSLVYADEADLINVALFGTTAANWRRANKLRAKNGENVRDSASINELIILSNMESYNAEMIRQGINKKQRFENLRVMVMSQSRSLADIDPIKSLKKLKDTTYLEAKE
ncbi:KilA-N domain-containing protein [Candidatus Saccharibacteria bacterium]|nr:KilA-N domain-containing protein [Candidatus Saccharibacteria bacterium]